MFRTFFGELHERYGQSVLRRIVDHQTKAKKKARLFYDTDYGTRRGSKPDNVLVETVGAKNTRVTFFEFKVGRPRYRQGIVKGDVEAFNQDLEIKIQDGLNQEISLFSQLAQENRTLSDLAAKNVTAWFFVVVVTDPYTAMELFLDSLRKKIAALEEDTGCRLYEPFVLCLSELEQLEALSEKRVSDLLLDWVNGPVRQWPFNSFFVSRTKGKPLKFDRIGEAGESEMRKFTTLLLPNDGE